MGQTALDPAALLAHASQQPVCRTGAMTASPNASRLPLRTSIRSRWTIPGGPLLPGLSTGC